MATLNASFIQVLNRSMAGSVLAVPQGANAQGPTALTTSGTAQTVQRGGADWTMPSDGYVAIYCDGAVRVAEGETAASGASPVGHYVPASTLYTISVRSGSTLSVIDA